MRGCGRAVQAMTYPVQTIASDLRSAGTGERTRWGAPILEGTPLSRDRYSANRRVVLVAVLMVVLAACGAEAPESTVDEAAAASPATAGTAAAGDQPTAPAATGPTTTGPAATATVGATDTAPQGTIPLGVLVPYTGQYSFVGESVQPVVRMVVDEEINAGGGIGGAQIELVQGDTEGVVDAGVLAARKLISTDNVVALIGPTSLSFTGVRRVLADSGTPMISPTAGTIELDDAGKELFFRTVPSDSLGGRAVARAVTDPAYLARDAAFERPALMVGQAPALVSFQEPIAEAVTEFGGELVSNSTYTTGKQSYRSEVSGVLGADPDVIILIGEPADSARIMQDAFEAGYEGTWFVTQDQTTAEYVELAGPELVEGIYGLIEAVADEELLAEFTERLGQEPAIFQTNAYDAINVTGLAMLTAELSGEGITKETIAANLDSVANPEEGDVVVTSYNEGKEALEAGDGIDYQGLSGPVDFDEFGNITAPFTIQQVQDGSFTNVATLPAEELQ